MTKKISLKERIRKRLVFESRKLEPYLSDKRFLQIRFWLRVGYWPNLDNPKTFNEKLNWLKLHDIHPEYTRMVDKVTAKEYVAGIIGPEYIIPTFKEPIHFSAISSHFMTFVGATKRNVII